MQTTQAETRRGGRDDSRTRRSSRLPGAPGSTSLRHCLTLCAVAAPATLVAERIPVAAPLIVVAIIPAARIDLVERRLPNRLVAWSALVGLAAVVASALIGASPNLTGAVAGAAAMALPLLAIHLASPASMGFGDVKAAVVLGAALGLISPVLAVVGLVAASAGSALYGILTRQRTVPFGPGLVVGSTVALLLAASPFASFVDSVPPSIRVNSSQEGTR